MSRPKVHKTPAERQAAYRSRTRTAQLTLPQADKLDELATLFDTSRNELVHSMIQFALMNRNWKQLGLFGTRTWNAPQSTRPAAYVGPLGRAGHDTVADFEVDQALDAEHG